MSGLVVLEGRWQNNRNVSVRSLFDLLMDMEFQSIHRYHFENFANRDALHAIVEHVCRQGARKKYLYIGAHGNQNAIRGSVSNISRAEIRNILRNQVGPQIRGIFFGSCLFGNQNNAAFFFNRDAGIANSIRWIAGYGVKVDWIQSSALDIIFWQQIFRQREAQPDANENIIIEHVCTYLKENLSGLVTTLQFQVYRRRPHHLHEPQALI
ncbi:hypothetical protein AruPA_17675 [Acidiphilium sp. PA]|uniref:hypothetical protein n=1 Tax=Acidiphilium sp. PA TaxID=2871705 RepID=UPI00224333B0|nr:hypothetical protein [Acidiphilium sp. PA]MCW8308866.1 hypothetical protein [Acidiphilium sp. PA]